MNCKVLLFLITNLFGFLPPILAQGLVGQSYMNSGDSISGFVSYDGALGIKNPDLTKARAIYFKAAKSFLAESNSEQLVEAMTRAAWTSMIENNYKLSIIILDSALHSYQTHVAQAPMASVNLFHSKAWSHLQSGQVRAAYHAYNTMLLKIKVTNLDPHPSLYKALLYRGITGRQLGFIGQAKRDFLAVLKVPEVNLYYLSSAYNSLGLVAKQSGDYVSAINYYNNALAVGQKLYREESLTPLYNNMGSLYTKMKRMTEAKKYFSEGIIILGKAYGEKRFAIHTALYNSLSEYHLANRDLDSARYYAELSLIVNQEINEGKSDIAWSRLKIAAIDFETGNFEIAEALLDQVELERTNGFKFPAIIDTEYYLLRMKLAENEGVDRQLEIINFALDSMLGSGTLGSGKFDTEISLLDAVKLLNEKAGVQKRLFLQDNNIAELEESLVASNLAIDYLILAYDDLFFGNGKNELTKASKEILETHLETLELMAEKDRPSLVFDEVLKVFELNKSNQLLEAIIDAEMFGVTNDSMQIELTTLDSKIRESKNNKNDSLINMFTLQREIVLAAIEKERPGYYAQKFNKMQPDAGKIKKAIGQDAILLEYFVGTNYVYRLSISKGETHFARIGKTVELSNMINSYLNAIETHDFETYAEIGLPLYTKLIGFPINDLPENIVIIPDAFISRLPFATLPTKVGSNYRQTQFIINNSITRYHYSSTLLIKEASDSPASESLIAYAPMANGENRSLVATNPASRLAPFAILPATEEEAQKASSIMSGEIRLNEQATELDFKNNAGNYQTIHLATHNLMDPFNANSNALIFADDEDSSEDGFLTLYEVQEMGIKADLVTLSACNTGLGEYVYGEGVMSMARGFLFAGTKNVVMSLWTVNDNTTAGLMENFYTNQRDNRDVALSLAQTKRSYLKSADEIFADPYYWGAWVSVGPLKQKQTSVALYIILGVLAISVIAYRSRTYFT